MPAFDEKDVGYYTETNPEELTKCFSACNAEERLALMFFLYSGCREREVMFACWNDIDFTHRTYTVRRNKNCSSVRLQNIFLCLNASHRVLLRQNCPTVYPEDWLGQLGGSYVTWRFTS